jgi:hypothetical protein
MKRQLKANNAKARAAVRSRGFARHPKIAAGRDK